MSDGHVRRTKPSRASRAGRRRRHFWLASVTLPIILIAPAVSYVVITGPAPSDVEAVIKQAGFDPLKPPSRLRGPGALYEVEDGLYRKVCDADPDLLRGRLRKSPTQSQFRERLETGGFSMSGEFLQRVNVRLGGERVTSIEYRLTDPAVSEIALSDLSDIEDKLLSQKSCEETVERLLKAHRKVCSGYAALSATTSYKVHVSAKFESGSDGRASTIGAVQQALQEHTEGQIRSTGTDELTGEDLFYGIQLSSLCITLNTDTEPSVLTNSDVPQRANPRSGT